jgi:hypothetical protein
MSKNEQLEVATESNRVRFGKNFTVDFQRTLRIPDDGNTYPLPPGLGRFPIARVQDYLSRAPDSWKEHGGIFIPMYQREALWLNFSGRYWRPNAVKVAVGKINALTGKAWDQKLSGEVQDYMVSPPQPWLDGIKTGKDTIRQFVAMPLGMGYTVEAQLTGKEEFGGIQIIVYEPKQGIFPDEEPPRHREIEDEIMFCMAPAYSAAGAEMGIAAGGQMEQTIYEDDHGVDTWDENNFGRLYIHIVNSMDFREITGKEPPATPISAKTYAEHGLPWFDLYDEDKNDLPVADKLKTVKSVKEIDKEKGFVPQQADDPSKSEKRAL